MDRVHLTSDRLQELIERFGQARIAVLGDFFLDKYLDVDPALEEPSVETGKSAHQVIRVRCSPGAAGTVVCNLQALGAGHLWAIGFTGDDGEGFDLRKSLAQRHCRTEHLHVEPTRYTPTYLKPRDAHLQSLEAEHSRYDTKNWTATDRATEDRVIESLDALLPNVDAVVVLDQVEAADFGVVTARVGQALAERAQKYRDVVFWADSRRRIHRFPGLIIKPNQFELLGIENPAPTDSVSLENLLDAAQKIRSENDAAVVVTRGSAGMLVSDPQWTEVPAVHLDGPLDPTGAGDSATAGTVLALCSGATLPEAALVGNLVASVTIEQIATTGVCRPDQLLQRLNIWQLQQPATPGGP